MKVNKKRIFSFHFMAIYISSFSSTRSKVDSNIIKFGTFFCFLNIETEGVRY